MNTRSLKRGDPGHAEASRRWSPRVLFLLLLAALPAGASQGFASGASLFEFDEDLSDWCILDRTLGGVASIGWSALDWAGPYTQGSLLLDADLSDGNPSTECSAAVQSSPYEGGLPPGTGRLGDFSSRAGAFACWLFVPDTTDVGPSGLEARVFARTGDSENHPAWGDPLGWDRYDGPWCRVSHGWNRVWVPVDSACHYESGEPRWGEIEFLDILQALGVEVGSRTDQTVSVHIDHVISASTGGARLESVTWCGVPGSDCYGTDDPFLARLDFGPFLPDSIDLKGASVSISWRPHQLELLGIQEGDVWDAATKTINNLTGRARVDCASFQPRGVRVSAGDLLTGFQFQAQRSGLLSYWITSIDLRDAENFDILPDTTAGDLGGSFWFYLGDFTEDFFGGYGWDECPDRDIDVYDLNLFSIQYGLVDTDALFDCRTDIGPTTTGWIHGVPTPDGVIDFADLAIFAASYAYQGQEVEIVPPAPARGDWETLRNQVVSALESRSWLGREIRDPAGRQTIDFTVLPADTTIAIGDSVWVNVWVSGDAADFKTYQVLMDYDPQVVALLDLKQGPLFFEGPHQSFFRDRSAGDSLDVMDSVLGAGLTAGGPGSIIRILFRGIQGGVSPVRFSEVRPADVQGLAMPATTADGMIRVYNPTGVGPEARDDGEIGSRVLAVRPNPSSDACVLTFSLPQGRPAGAWEIEIYDVRGRRVRSWGVTRVASETVEVEWDARDASGARVPAGVYFATLRTGSQRIQAKIILTP